MHNQIKILLTGADGYVGGLVYQQLENLSRYSFMNPDLSPNIYVKPLFFLDHQSIKPLMNESFDLIFHCAVSGGRRFEIDEPGVYQKNIELFNLIKQLNYKKIIHFTSAADLGRDKDIRHALPGSVMDASPTDFFGKSKNIISKNIVSNNLGLNIRIFNIYGRCFKRAENFIDYIIDSCMRNQEIIIQDDRYFDFFYIENLRLLLVKIINNEILSDYNLVHNKKYKISEFVLFIVSNLKSNSNVKILKEGYEYTGSNNNILLDVDSIDPLRDLKKYIEIRQNLIP